MEDMLSFLSPEIRQANMSVDEFCGKLSISKQKFYRFVKEPRRFTEKNLNDIADILNFSSSQRQKLMTYRDGVNQSSSEPETSTAEDAAPVPESEENLYSETAKRMMREILLFPESVLVGDRDDPLVGFEYHDSDDSLVGRSSVRRTANLLLDSIPLDTTVPSEQILHDFEVTIYNCVDMNPSLTEAVDSVRSKKMTVLLAQLFDSLENVADARKQGSINIRVSHFIPDDNTLENSLEKKLTLFRSLRPLLSTVPDYAYSTKPLSNPLWTTQNNWCVIKYSQINLSNRKTKTAYSLITFTQNGDAHLCSLGDESHLYRFFTADTRGIDLFKEKLHYTTIDVNRNAYESLTMSPSSLYVLKDLCFDNIETIHWESLIKRLGSRLEDPKTLPLIHAVAKNFGIQVRESERYFDEFFQTLNQFIMKDLASRYEISKNRKQVILFDQTGFEKFVNARMISDMLLPPDTIGAEFLRFSDDEMRKIIDYIIDNIGNIESIGNRGPHFYIFKNNNRIFHNVDMQRGCSYGIFSGIGIRSFDANTNHKNTIHTTFDNSEVPDAMYNYMVRYIEEEQSKDYGAVLKKEESIQFLEEMKRCL